MYSTPTKPYSAVVYFSGIPGSSILKEPQLSKVLKATVRAGQQSVRSKKRVHIHSEPGLQKEIREFRRLCSDVHWNASLFCMRSRAHIYILFRRLQRERKTKIAAKLWAKSNRANIYAHTDNPYIHTLADDGFMSAQNNYGWPKR